MKGTSLLRLNPVSTLYSMLLYPHVGREQLVAFENERLRRLLEDAYRNVAHYRGFCVRQKLKPHDVRTVERGWLLYRLVAWFHASWKFVHVDCGAAAHLEAVRAVARKASGRRDRGVPPHPRRLQFG